MDICIKDDETISRENHAVVSFDARDKIFYFRRVTEEALSGSTTRPSFPPRSCTHMTA